MSGSQAWSRHYRSKRDLVWTEHQQQHQKRLERLNSELRIGVVGPLQATGFVDAGNVFARAGEIDERAKSEFRRRNIAHDLHVLPCGHYSTGVTPFKWIDGLIVCRFLSRSL